MRLRGLPWGVLALLLGCGHTEEEYALKTSEVEASAVRLAAAKARLAETKAKEASLTAQLEQLSSPGGGSGVAVAEVPAPPPAATPPTAAPVAVAAAPAVGAASAFTAGAPQPNAYAVIVGVEHYAGLPPPTGAKRDAERFADLARRTLGVSEKHLQVMIDGQATRATIERNIAWAASSVPPGGRIYFFFSGHGAPDASTGTSYLVPSDGDPAFLGQTAIATADVVKQLSESKAREVLAVVDSCFSGAGGRSVLPQGARPLVHLKEEKPVGQIAFFSAASANEISGPALDNQGGLFSGWVLEGLGKGAADADGDGQVSLKELSDYVTPRVQREAKQSNRAQTPSLLVGKNVGAPASFIVEWGLPAH